MRAEDADEQWGLSGEGEERGGELTVLLSIHPNPSNKLDMKMMAEQITPLTNPTLNSLSNRPIMLPMLTFADANP